MKILSRFAFPALLAGLLLAMPVLTGEVRAQDQSTDQTAQPPKDQPPVKTTTETIGNWTLACSTSGESTRCAIQQSLANSKTNQVVASATVRIAKQGGAELMFETPTGVELAPGVVVAVDGQEAGKAPFTACAPRGCGASIMIDQALINSLAKGKVLSIALRSIRGKTVTLEFQLEGFTKAYAAFKSGNTK